MCSRFLINTAKCYFNGTKNALCLTASSVCTSNQMKGLYMKQLSVNFCLLFICLTVSQALFADSKGLIGELSPSMLPLSQGLLGDRGAHYISGTSLFTVNNIRQRISDIDMYGNSLINIEAENKKTGWNTQPHNTNYYPIYLSNEKCIVYGNSSKPNRHLKQASKYTLSSAESDGLTIALKLTSRFASLSMLHIKCLLTTDDTIEDLEKSLERIFTIKK